MKTKVPAKVCLRALACTLVLALATAPSVGLAYAEPDANDQSAERAGSENQDQPQWETTESSAASSSASSSDAETHDWIKVDEKQEPAAEPAEESNMFVTFCSAVAREAATAAGNSFGVQAFSDTETTPDTAFRPYDVPRPYDQIRLSGKKVWNDGAEKNDDGDYVIGKDEDGNDILRPKRVTISIQGFVDYNRNGIIDDEERWNVEDHRLENNSRLDFEYPETFDFNGDGITYRSSLDSDDEDAVANYKDMYYDLDGDGIIAESERSRIDYPYFYDTLELNKWWDWEYETGALDRHFRDYSFLQSSNTCIMLPGDENEYEWIYEITELSQFDNYATKTVYVTSTGGAGSTWGELNLVEKNTDANDKLIPDGDTTTEPNGKITYGTINVVNTLDGYEPGTGSLTISKRLDGPIFSMQDSEGATSGTSTVVFRVEGKNAQGATVYGPTHVGITFKEPGTLTRTLEGLPLDAEYTVTELTFDGSGYVVAAGSTPQVTHAIGAAEADAPVLFEFANASDGSESPNLGVVNRYTGSGVTQDWGR